jgi:hypothetical protein
MSFWKRTQGSSIIKTIQLMLLTIKVADYPHIHNKHTNAVKAYNALYF